MANLALLAARHAAAVDSAPLDCAAAGVEPCAADAATVDGTGDVGGEGLPEAFSTAPPIDLHGDSTDEDGDYGPGWDEDSPGAS